MWVLFFFLVEFFIGKLEEFSRSYKIGTGSQEKDKHYNSKYLHKIAAFPAEKVNQAVQDGNITYCSY